MEQKAKQMNQENSKEKVEQAESSNKQRPEHKQTTENFKAKERNQKEKDDVSPGAHLSKNPSR
jgi:hypothetical protein